MALNRFPSWQEETLWNDFSLPQEGPWDLSLLLDSSLFLSSDTYNVGLWEPTIDWLKQPSGWGCQLCCQIGLCHHNLESKGRAGMDTCNALQYAVWTAVNLRTHIQRILRSVRMLEWHGEYDNQPGVRLLKSVHYCLWKCNIRKVLSRSIAIYWGVTPRLS